MTNVLSNLEKLLTTSKDNALLRYSLGLEYLKVKDSHAASVHLQKAVELNPQYSAAWKILGRALAESAQLAAAAEAYKQGIAVAEAKGDKQAAKEMTVFRSRILKQLQGE